MAKMKKLKQTQALKPLTEGEKAFIENFKKRLSEKKPPKIKLGAGNKVISDELTNAKIAEALGVTDAQLGSKFLSQTSSTFPSTDSDENRCNTALAILYGIKPKDEIESMLAVQMIGAVLTPRLESLKLHSC